MHACTLPTLPHIQLLSFTFLFFNCKLNQYKVRFVSYLVFFRLLYCGVDGGEEVKEGN